jgi:hypothetical protein
MTTKIISADFSSGKNNAKLDGFINTWPMSATIPYKTQYHQPGSQMLFLAGGWNIAVE